MRGHYPAAKLLLEEGADTEHRISDGKTVLSLAAYQGMEDVVELLLLKKADISTQDAEGMTPLHGMAKNRCPRVMAILMSHGTPLEIRNFRGWTALDCAARQGFLDVAKLLLEAGADAAAEADDGKSPLTVSIEQVEASDEGTVRILQAAQSAH